MIIRNFLFCKNMGLIRKNLLFIKGPVFFILHVSYIHRCKTSWRGLEQKSSKKLESAVFKCNSSKAGFSITLIPSFCHVQWRCCLSSVFPLFMCFCYLKSVKRYSWFLFFVYSSVQYLHFTLQDVGEYAPAFSDDEGHFDSEVQEPDKSTYQLPMQATEEPSERTEFHEHAWESVSGFSSCEPARPMSPGPASTQYYYFYQGIAYTVYNILQS